MICETFDIKNENSQEYARLNTYLISHSDSIKTETRPLIILCPGGGYWFTSEREGEMLALQFVAAGFHAAILWYSVKPATFPTALLELAKSVELVRKHAKEWYVDPDKIVVEGCSAGGHLAASYGVFWHEDFVSNKLQVSKDILKPNGMILSYPVITSGEFAHRGSFNNLLRDQYTEEMLEKLEKGMISYRKILEEYLGHSIEGIEGLGAAGGLGAALYGFLNGKMQSGIDVLLELNNFEEKLDSTDIVITGEGKTDYQSACGKVIHGIARKCKKYNVPVLVISGSLGEEINQLYSMGVSGMEASVCNIISLNNAMDNAEKYLCYAAERVLRVLKTGMELVQNEKI